MCGVFGIVSRTDDAFAYAVNGLFQMQHRGQDAAGIAISDGHRIRLHKALGYVRQVFADVPDPEFAGRVACGHVRYPTQGANRMTNAQPHVLTTLHGSRLALCSNGDLTNYWIVRADLERQGVEFLGTNDAELILKFIAFQHLERRLPLVDAIRQMQRTIRGAYSACLITTDSLWAIRDPLAIRPMCFGGDSEVFVVASETVALDINRVDHLGDLEPGEIIEFRTDGMTRHPMDDALRQEINGLPDRSAHCVFEYVYFSRPDSISFGQRVYDVRKRIGQWLARNDDIQGDVVVPVPDSSNAIALGYAHASGIPFEFGLIRNHYVGRTFISPTQVRRDEGVKLKFNPLRSVFKDRRVILVDDSIVRGTTLRKIVRMVRQAGAAEVHLRIGSPITKFPCFYGVDTPEADKLIGNQLDAEQIREHLTADSLHYTTVEGLREAVGGESDRWCMACFDGRYAVPIVEQKQAYA